MISETRLTFEPAVGAVYDYDYSKIVAEINSLAASGDEKRLIQFMRFWCQESLFFIAYFVLRIPVNHPFLVERIKEVQAQNDRTLDLWSREFFKCLREDSIIWMSDGSEKRICDIKVGDYIMGYDSGMSTPVKVIAKSDPLKKHLFGLTLRSNRKVVCGPEHPFLTMQGLKKLHELKEGDFIAVPRFVRPRTTSSLTELEARFLAYMIAEGSCTSGSCGFTNFDDDIVEDFKFVCDKLGFRVINSTPGHYGLSKRTTAPRDFIRKFGVDCLAKHKKLPYELMTASDDVVANFIAAYWACDGSVNSVDNLASCISASKTLSLGVQNLLHRFGIYSSLTEVKNDHAGAWMVNVTGISNLSKLYILSARKQQRLEELLEAPNKPGKDDPIPTGWERLLKHSVRARLFRNSDIYYCDNASFTSRCKVRRFAELDDSAELINFCDNDFRWDIVKELTDEGSGTAYDIQVGGDNLFIADGVVTHNSSIITYALNVQNILIDPDVRIGIFSHTRNIAKAFLRRIKITLESNDVLKTLFPDILYENPSSQSPKWALDVNTKILTMDGWKDHGNLQVGDKIFGSNGQVITVIGNSGPMMGLPCRRVQFDDCELVASADHLWPIKHKTGQRWDTFELINVTTDELPIRDKCRHSPSTPIIHPEVSTMPPMLDPYVLGLWLGDGTAGTNIISMHRDDEDEVLSQLELLGFSYYIHRRNPEDNFSMYGIEDLKMILSMLGCLKDKHVPNRYWLGSKLERLSLLQGLMDSDGTCKHDISSGGMCQFCNTNWKLAFAVFYLTTSLGLRPSIYAHNPGNGNKIIYRVYFVGIKSIPPFRLSRKLCKCNDSRHQTGRYIRSIDDIESVPVNCIKVDAEDGIYLAGYNLVQTHNSEDEGLIVRRSSVFQECTVEAWGLTDGQPTALDVNTKILTPYGWKCHGDLQPGDEIFGANGQVIKVVFNTGPMYDKECRLVSFDDGEIVAASDHLWPVHRLVCPRDPITGRQAHTWEEGIIVTDIVTTDNLPVGAKRQRLLATPVIQIPDHHYGLPPMLDPYVLGVWLGDGSSDNAIITTADESILDEIERAGFEYHMIQDRGNYGMYRVRPLRQILKMMGLLHNKHIPKRYLEGSPAERLALLQGLMDTDGGCHSNGTGQCTFSNTKWNLISGVFYLAASLGMKPGGITHRDDGDPNHARLYTVSFLGTKVLPPFRMERKLARCKDSRHDAGRYVRAIDNVDSVPVNCIQVDALDGLYLASEWLIPTHNSKHFSVLNYDDTVTVESVSTPAQIKKTSDCFRLSMNLGTDGGKKRVIGTIYHYADLHMELEQQGGWIVRKRPAEDAHGNPTFLSAEKLAEKRRDQGPYVYSCQMLLSPVTKKDQRFRPEWLRYYRTLPTPLSLYLICDPANEKKKKLTGGDFTVYWLWGLDAYDNLFMIDCIRDRLTLTERWKALKEMRRKHPGIQRIGYEQYGMAADIQHYEEMMLIEGVYFNILELGGNKLSKEDRVARIIPLFEQGRVHLPERLLFTDKEGKEVDLVQVFVDEEYLRFPFSQHDDMLDAASRIEDKALEANKPSEDWLGDEESVGYGLHGYFGGQAGGQEMGRCPITGY